MTNKSVQVDYSKCQGHGKCMLGCPEVFEEDVQGYPVVTVETIPDQLLSSVQACIDDCPERALTLA